MALSVCQLLFPGTEGGSPAEQVQGFSLCQSNGESSQLSPPEYILYSLLSTLYSASSWLQSESSQDEQSLNQTRPSFLRWTVLFV